MIFTAQLKDGRKISFRCNQPNEPIHTRINGIVATDEDILCAVKRLQDDKEDFLGVVEAPDGSLDYQIDRIYGVTPKGYEEGKRLMEEEKDDEEPQYWWQKGQYA